MGRTEKWHITADGQGMGGFLCPPGHPNHVYVVWEGYFRSMARARTLMALDSCVKEEWVSASIRQRAQNLINQAQLTSSELWLRHTYGYMGGMYWPQGVEPRSAMDMVAIPARDGDPERHGAVVHIRKYFPDHEPRIDLITAGADVRLYGS